MNKKELKQLIREELANVREGELSKYLLSNFIENEWNEIGDVSLYNDQPRDVTLNFLKNGRPSKHFMVTIINKLKKMGFDIDEESMTAHKNEPFTQDFKSGEVNPYEQPGGRPSRSGYTGD
tara:strand:- start:247 stop:609 length:363 start_codon:yes stop_codon:yes gene_type:complete